MAPKDIWLAALLVVSASAAVLMLRWPSSAGGAGAGLFSLLFPVAFVLLAFISGILLFR